MKKSYQRLLIFEIIIFALLFLNSFVLSILSNYKMIFFLLIVIIVFRLIFRFEKDKHRYVKDVIFNILIVLLVSFVIYYLFGLLIGFYKINNYYNLYGLKNFVFPLILVILLREYLRYQVLTKAEGSKFLIVLTIILFIFLDVSTAIYYADFSNAYSTFLFVSLTFIPSISNNIVASYIDVKLGYKPNIVWLLITQLYVYLIPIIPNPNEYILSIIRFIFPLIIMYIVYSFFEKINDDEIDRNYRKKRNLSIVLLMLFMFIIIYLTSGYFRYYAIAIASGSMSPNINKGDIVVIQKIYNSFDDIKYGDVIAYKYNGVVVVHRVVNIIKEYDKYYFYTKGDANNDMDNFAIYGENVVGIVKFRVPYIGLATVWLNEL